MMGLKLRISSAALVAAALVAVALWTWESAPDIAADMQTSRPDAALWAARSAALAAAALAQSVLLHFVIGGLYPRRAMDDALRLCFGVACVLACVSAVALGMAAR
jgi:hypothetical protein